MILLLIVITIRAQYWRYWTYRQFLTVSTMNNCYCILVIIYALNLIKSYLSERNQCVHINGILLEQLILCVYCVLPQYRLLIGAIIRSYDTQCHIYAGDMQLYLFCLSIMLLTSSICVFLK